MGMTVNTGVVTRSDCTDIGSGTTCGPHSMAHCDPHVAPSIECPACPSFEYSIPSLSAWGESPYPAGTVMTSSAVNGTEKGAVAPVKNQDSCVSCWHFQQWSLPMVLGRLQLEICDTADSTCNGGFMDDDFAFAEKNGPCTEASYSYALHDLNGVSFSVYARSQQL